MRVRIGVCLLALCWPLLATAAPVLTADSTPACCRRDGAHHCAAPASSGPTVSAVCPYAAHPLKFSGAKAARPAALLVISRSSVGSAVALATRTAAQDRQSLLIS